MGVGVSVCVVSKSPVFFLLSAPNRRSPLPRWSVVRSQRSSEVKDSEFSNVHVLFYTHSLFRCVQDRGLDLLVRFRAQSDPVPHPPFPGVGALSNLVDLARPAQKVLFAARRSWQLHLFNGRVSPDCAAVSLSH